MVSYRIAAPDEYLAITGMGVRDKSVKIAKSSWIWPFQSYKRFSVQPHDYAMDLQAMTKEKLQFLLPVVFTVGPDVNQRGANSKRKGREESDVQDVAPAVALGANGGANDDDWSGGMHADEHLHNHGREDCGDALMKYAMLLTGGANNQGPNNGYLEGIVKGIIEGEVRVLVSSMTMEEIFTERELFKKRIFKNIQSELDQFGLKIYNANVKELKDAPHSVYFESLSRKAHEGATNQARIDVAEAQLKGNVGESKRKGEQEREIAKIHAETAVQKTERDIERAEAEAKLSTEKAAFDRDVEVARITAQRETQAKDEELKKEVEIKRIAAETERLRASDVVKATIARESKQQAADAKAYEVKTDALANFEKSKNTADAAAYKVKVDTEASNHKTRVDAEAGNYAAIQQAEAALQKKLKEAKGMAAMADAWAKMSQAFGGPAGLLQYMMIEKGTFVELAKANAGAVQGMQPKISVWNTGAQAGSGSSSNDEGSGQSSIDVTRNVYQMLPPLMTTINEQTGITLPEWQFGRIANGPSERERIEDEKDAKVNGNGKKY